MKRSTKIDKSLTKLRGGRKKPQSPEIRSEREDITTNLKEIKRAVKKYYEQLYDKHKVPKQNQEEIEDKINF